MSPATDAPGNLTRKRRGRIQSAPHRLEVSRDLLLVNLLRRRIAAPAGIAQVGRLGADDLHDRWFASMCPRKSSSASDPSDRAPLGRPGWPKLPPRRSSDEHHMVVGVTVGLDQTLAQRERVIAQVHVAVLLVVEIVAVVDDRRGRQPAAAVGEAPGAVGRTNCRQDRPRDRAPTMLPSLSKPPIRAFRSRNCSVVMVPALSAARPY